MKSRAPGERLRAWRERREWSVNRLATTIGIAWHHVDGYERGRMPSLTSAVRIQALTGIPASAWVAEAEAAKR